MDKATSDDDLETIADMICENSGMLYGIESQEDRRNLIRRMVTLEMNEISYKNIWVEKDIDGKIKTIIVAFDPDRLDINKSFDEVKKASFMGSYLKYYKKMHSEWRKINKPDLYKKNTIYVFVAATVDKIHANMMNIVENFCQDLYNKTNYEALYTDVLLMDENLQKGLENIGFKKIRVIEYEFIDMPLLRMFVEIRSGIMAARLSKNN